MRLLTLVFSAVLCAPFADSQALRYDSITSTTNSACAPGAQCPLLVTPATAVTFCTGSALGTANTAGTVVTSTSGPSFTGASGSIQIGSITATISTVVSSTILVTVQNLGTQTGVTYSTLSGCRANPATTYTSTSAGTSCPTTAQLTPATGGACVSASDNQGNAGGWFLPGSYYYYLAQLPSAGGKVTGPYPMSIGSSTGTPANATVDANYATLILADTAAGVGSLYCTKGWNGLVTHTYTSNFIALATCRLQPASGQTVTFTVANAALTNICDISAGGTCIITSATGQYYPQWWGAKCDSSTDDHAAFAAAVAAIPQASTLYLPSGLGCVLNSGVTTTKPIAFAGSAPGSPAQIWEGADGITPITISGVNAASITGIEFNANGHTGGTGVALSGANHTTFDHVTWTGAWTNPISATSVSLFTTVKDSSVESGSGPMLFAGFSDVNVFTNTAFNGVGGGIQAHNGYGLSITGGSFEGGSTILTYNWLGGCSIKGVYFENQGTPVASAAYVTLGLAFGGEPTFGCDISGSVFNGGYAWGVLVGPGGGDSIEGNTFVTDAYAVAMNGGSAYAPGNRDLSIGPNYYNINGAGYDETKILLNGGPSGLGSNVSQLVFNPMLFSGSMPVCQAAWVPTADACVWWDGVSLHMLNGTGGTTFLMNTPQSVGTQIHSPAGLVSTASVTSVWRNAHDVYFGENGASGGGNGCGITDAYAAVECTNDNYPIVKGVGNAERWRLPTANPGEQLAPVVMVTSVSASLGSCGAGQVGISVPITNSGTSTPGATIASIGSPGTGGWAHCNGNAGTGYAWQFSY